MNFRYSADFGRSRLGTSIDSQTSELILHVPLSGTEVNRFNANPAVASSSPCFSQKIFVDLQNRTRLEGASFIFSGIGKFFEMKFSPQQFESILTLSFCMFKQLYSFELYSSLLFFSHYWIISS